MTSRVFSLGHFEKIDVAAWRYPYEWPKDYRIEICVGVVIHPD
jgi:hypothetical protein